MDKLMELASRVEASEGADRELDAEVFLAAYPKIDIGWGRPLLLKKVWPTINGGRPVFWYETKSGCSGGIDDRPYTASLDAVRTLIDPADEWELTTLYNIARAVVGLNRDHQTQWPGHGEHAGANPVLALLASALRARAS